MIGQPMGISELSREEKLALLARLAQDRSRAKETPGEEAQRSYPLAFVQQRFWFLDQLEPGSVLNNIFRGLRLSGLLHVSALEKTFAELIRRHAALRTRFPVADGEPRQVVEAVLPGGGPPLPIVDLCGLPEAARQACAAVLAAEESRRPFDLAHGPLIRAALVRQGPREHVLLMSLHHIVADGWSVGILFSELSALYGAFLRDGQSPLAAVPARYGDFARLQRERLHGEGLAEELAFWRGRLAGAPPVLELPVDHPRQSTTTPRGGLVPASLADPVAGGLKALGRREGATLFMVLLALYDVLLYRHTGQEDFVVGLPVANRNRTALEGVIGCFASTLLIRTRLSREMSFRELIAQVRREALAVFAHSDLPFEKLVEELHPERDLSHNPIFQVMFTLQSTPRGAFALPGLELAPVIVERGLAKLDLSLDVTEVRNGISGYFEYSADIFEESTVARLVLHLRALAAAAVADPQARLGRLPMLADQELRQILVDWNQRFTGLPPLVPARVAEQARRTPEAPAVLCGDQRLTYAELSRRANRLARYLRGRGVGPERSVGLCLERSLEMPLALLAVLKAGGAWVPLDPEYPHERLALMIEDTAMPVLLTQERLLDRLPVGIAGRGPAVVCLDRLDLSAEDPADPEWPIHPESLAYIVYTSGSTGRPKGVAVPHRSLANHADLCALRYRLGPSDRVLQFTSISFDITSEEIFPTWLAGGAVVPRPPGLFPSFREFAELIERHAITAVDLPTAYWHEWVGEMVRTRTPPPPSLRLVVIGTEQALPERVADWLELVGDRVRLNNSFASTEATVTTMVYEPGLEDLPRFRAGDRVPVGRNLHNCCAYVLDAGLEPVPVGVPGDIYIAGPNVSRGYANCPDRTAASFLPDPFAAGMGYGAGQRMYRQGDLGRWLPTGDLELLGRRDDQVKIRGFRVEPDEVKSALARHPAVKDCIVLVKSDGPKGKRLVGYLTPAPGRTATVKELRGFLRESLPEHMIPAALMVLDALPLTPNGRVDRRALLEPPSDRMEVEGAFVAPQTALEEILEGIWGEVLGISRIGSHDNFFDLGGHSLLGTQLVSRVREQLRVELPLRAIFESPTLAGLARRIDELRRAEPGVSPPAITRVSRQGELPLAFSQRRLWFLDRLEPGKATYNIPLALHFVGELDAGKLGGALDAISERHEALRITFTEVDGKPRQIVQPPCPRALAVIDVSGLEPGRRAMETRLQMAQEAGRPFSLERGPLLRTVLLRLAGDESILLATLHHIISDGWSVPIFVRETASLYAAAGTGEPPALPALAIQYPDFAHWQRQWLQGAVLEAELAHWRQRLSGLPPLIALPLDRPRPAVRNWRGTVRRITLGSDFLAALTAAGRRQGATPFMVLLAGFAALLHRYCGQESFAVGVPVAGRNRVEIEPLIGFFVNTLVLRCDVTGETAVRALVAQVRDTVLDADAHQDVPFEKLVEELSPARSLSHSPLFQVVQAFENLPREDFVAPGMKMTPVGIASGTSKFDLTLAVRVGDGATTLDLEYSTELFDAATIDRLANHLRHLLTDLTAAPERRVAELPLLDAAQRHQLAVEWNPAPVAGERGRASIHRLFEAQVERAPHRRAVSEGGGGRGALTYRELDERANRLARHLLAAGARPGDLVGLCFERSLDLVVALLATLKAGASYLPLDPSSPAERLGFALADSGVSLVLTLQSLAGSLPERQGVRVIAVDAEAAAIAAASPRCPELPAAADDPDLPAYVIYTSGSTGRPKGVVVPHGHVTRLFSATAPWFGFGPEDVWTLFHSYAFDFSVWEIWGALLHGGRLVVVPYWESRSPEAFYALLRDERVTVLNQTPSAFRQLQWAEETCLGGAPPDLALRLVIFGGEALEPAGLASWFARHGDERPLLVNMYGITETTVHVTYRPIRRADLAAGRGSVVGVPIPDLTLHIVDRDLEPQPIGVPGEIVVGGEGVARGYLGRPELTAARFVPDPYGPPGARLYRSGDLARRLPDGDLEYLGRIDRQVKIRGFRIEMGEIEALLSRHPAIAQTVVEVREEAPGEPQLAAYYVLAGEREVGAAELRAALRAELPDYMLPAWFVALAALPLTANGKVDRKALPAPDGSRPDLGHVLVPPAGQVEEAIAAIWAEVLRVERIGAHDDFFALGGHSLLATQVLSRLRQAIGEELPLRAIFEHPTVAGLAEAILQKELEQADAGLLAKLLAELEGGPV